MMVSTRKNILATIAYYDVLEYPLTFFEVRKYLLNYHNFSEKGEVSIFEVQQKLTELANSGFVGSYKGFFFLLGKKHLVDERIFREKISIIKLKRMRRLIALLRYIPFVRMIAATGSLSFRHGTRGSDWDMLVVLEEKALFTGRFLLTAFLQVIGKRRHGKKIADRACLNYFTGSESLTVRLQDWYSSHEYQVMVPFFQTFSQDAFYRSNGWMTDFRAQMKLPVTANRLQIKDTQKTLRTRTFLEKIFFHPKLERRLAAWQRKKIAKNPQTAAKGACIIADEHSLVFFPHPRGPKVFEKFQKRLSF